MADQKLVKMAIHFLDGPTEKIPTFTIEIGLPVTRRPIFFSPWWRPKVMTSNVNNC